MLEDLAALVAQLLLLVGLVAAVVDDRAGQRQHVERDRLGERPRRRELHGGAVVGQLGRAVGHLLDLLVELGDAGQAGAGDGLVGGGDQRDESGLVVQRAQHRHRGHRGAVRVGDDALGRGARGVRVDLRDDERDVRVHPPGGRVVDDDGARVGDPRARSSLELRLARREEHDVETAVVGRRGVLDGDVAVAATAGCGPAERAEAKSRSWSTGNWRSARMRRMTPPTCPVAPTMPILMRSTTYA